MKSLIPLVLSVAVCNAMLIKYPEIPPITNPGKCPNLSGITTCEFNPSSWGCFQDTDCGKGRKCCRNGCGRKDCYPAVVEKPVIKPPGPRSRCDQPKVIGNCPRGRFWWNLKTVLRWFFNKSTNRCEVFFYSGCRGNRNRFRTENACKSACRRYLPNV